MMLRTGSIYAALGSLAALAGCLVTNQNHCALNAGACGDGMACSMCAADNNGCVPLGSPLGAACLFAGDSTEGPVSDTDPPITTTSSPTTTETTIEPPTTTTIGPTSVDPTTETTQTSLDTTDTETTGPGPCVGDVVANPMCGGDEPYCVDGECIGCEGLDCGDVEPGKPTCEPNSGLCVECLGDADCKTDGKPACNAMTATCEQCSDHTQCPDTACNLETGECFPDESVLFVENTTAICDSGDGKTTATPLCTLAKALLAVEEGVPTTIKIKATGKPQSTPATVPPGDFTVAIVHYGNTVPTLAIGSADPALTLQSGNKVFMHRIGIWNSGNPASNPAVLCVDAVLWLDRQRIFDVRTAIGTNNCRVHIRQSTITAQTIGGIDMFGTDAAKSQLWVENSFITAINGSTFSAMRLGGMVQADLLYTTIALTSSPLAPIECVNNFTGSVNIRNSAVIGPGAHTGAGCAGKVTFTTSHESDESTQAQLAPTFSAFADGKFQAKKGGPLADKAVWKTGDPRVDFDGTPRPARDGAPDYAGADRPAL